MYSVKRYENIRPSNNRRIDMGNCACGGSGGAGPYAEGKELVEFVYHAHGGTLRAQAISGGGLDTSCQGCGNAFTLTTYVGLCPACKGVHAVAPPRVSEPGAIQFAGTDFSLSDL